MTSGAARMGAFYATIFAGTACSLPYIAPWFAARGLTGAEIGVVLGAPMLARLVTGPLLAVWADSFRLRRTALALLMGAGALAYASLFLVEGLALWLPLWFVAATAVGSVVPLTDVLALKTARREGFPMAWPRGMGSLAFILGTVGIGALLSRTGMGLVPVWIVAAAVASAILAWTVLPREPVHEAGPPSRAARLQGLGRLVTDPLFMTAIVANGLIQAAHAFYYGFSTLAWKAEGLSSGLIGLLWGWGVAVEILFLWFGEPLRRRLGPWRLLMLCGAAAALRWALMALSPPLWALWPLQTLHALTFAAGFTANIQIVERLSPPESVSAAQTLSGALSGGVLIGLATVFSGPLYDRYGAFGYLAMTAMALAGLACAWRLRRVLA